MDIDQMDVETAFLEGILDESEYIYMKCPEGMDLNDDECLEIHKGMYGLVQSARIFWKRFSKCLTSKEIGFKQSVVGQCLFFKIGNFGLIIILLYVDDTALIGDKRDIQETITLIRNTFTITVEGKLNDFLGCDILREEGKDEHWILQLHLVRQLEKIFGEIVTKKRCTNA